jgi:hypothetical protein
MDLGKVRQIAGSGDFICVVSVKDELRCWGNTKYDGLVPLPTRASGVAQVTVGGDLGRSWSHHGMCFVDNFGKGRCWNIKEAENLESQLGGRPLKALILDNSGLAAVTADREEHWFFSQDGIYRVLR